MTKNASGMNKPARRTDCQSVLLGQTAQEIRLNVIGFHLPEPLPQPKRLAQPECPAQLLIGRYQVFV